MQFLILMTTNIADLYKIRMEFFKSLGFQLFGLTLYNSRLLDLSYIFRTFTFGK